MKIKQLAGIALLSTAAIVTKAQNVTIGPSVGINHSWLSEFENKQFKPGLNAGVFVIYSIDPHWALGADVRYSMEGVKTKNENNQLVNTYKANLNYIRIPVKGIYFFGQKGNDFRPKLYAGPSLGFLVGGEASLESKSSTATQTLYKIKSKENYNSFDFGVVVGTGFNYRIHKKGIWLNFDLNYTHGFLDLSKNTDINNANRNLMASVGIGFPLGTF
jgi:outer membrane protein W